MLISLGAQVLVVCITSCQVWTSYQQQSKELTSCLKHNPESTLQTFWQAVSRRCQHDPYQLMELYDRVAATTAAKLPSAKDKCSALLQKQLRNSLIESSAAIFEDALLTNTFRNNFEIERLAKRIFQTDARISQAVFERLIDAVYLFVDKRELASLLFDNKDGYFVQMVTSLLYLNRRFGARGDFDSQLLPQFANYFRHIKLDAKFSLLPYEVRYRVSKAFDDLPETLLNIYSGTAARLLNVGHWEYLYAPRVNGPSEKQRTPLTWIQAKNSTDSDADLMVKFKDDDDDGKVAFTSDYNGAPAFLYVEEDIVKALFWLGSGSPETRWWLVHGYGDYIVLQNNVTKHLLCATLEYDENRRYVTLGMPSKRGDEDAACRWLAVACHYRFAAVSNELYSRPQLG